MTAPGGQFSCPRALDRLRPVFAPGVAGMSESAPFLRVWMDSTSGFEYGSITADAAGPYGKPHARSESVRVSVRLRSPSDVCHGLWWWRGRRHNHASPTPTPARQYRERWCRSVLSVPRRALTGRFTLNNVPSGLAVIRCISAGLADYTSNTTVAAGTTTHDIRLAAQEVFEFMGGALSLFVPTGVTTVRGIILSPSLAANSR